MSDEKKMLWSVVHLRRMHGLREIFWKAETGERNIRQCASMQGLRFISQEKLTHWKQA